MTEFLLSAAQGGMMNSEFTAVSISLLEGLWENVRLFFSTLLFALPFGLVITLTLSRKL